MWAVIVYSFVFLNLVMFIHHFIWVKRWCIQPGINCTDWSHLLDTHCLGCTHHTLISRLTFLKYPSIFEVLCCEELNRRLWTLPSGGDLRLSMMTAWSTCIEAVVPLGNPLVCRVMSDVCIHIRVHLPPCWSVYSHMSRHVFFSALTGNKWILPKQTPQLLLPACWIKNEKSSKMKTEDHQLVAPVMPTWRSVSCGHRQNIYTKNKTYTHTLIDYDRSLSSEWGDNLLSCLFWDVEASLRQARQVRPTGNPGPAGFCSIEY